MVSRDWPTAPAKVHSVNRSIRSLSRQHVLADFLSPVSQVTTCAAAHELAAKQQTELAELLNVDQPDSSENDEQAELFQTDR